MAAPRRAPGTGPARKRATTPRKAAAPKPPVVVDEDAPIDLDAFAAAGPDLVPLFSVAGREYMVEREPSPVIGLQGLKLMREQGREVAIAWLLEELIGEDGYAALIAARPPRAAMQEIVKRAMRVTVGPVDAAANGPLGRG